MEEVVLAKLDSDVVAGIAQAIATVIAVVIGYGLSVAADRRARDRANEMTAQERRLSTLVELVEALDELSQELRDVIQALAPVLFIDPSRATAAASRDAALASARRHCERGIERMRSAERRVGRLALKGRLIGQPAELQQNIERGWGTAQATVAAALSALAGEADAPGGLPPRQQELNEVVGVLLEQGRKLHEA